MPAESTTAKPRYRPLLWGLAIVFAASTIVYSAGWMYCVRQPPPPDPQVEVGFDQWYSAAGIEITNVYPNSPAEKAGLKVRDRIVAIDEAGQIRHRGGPTCCYATGWGQNPETR